MANLNQTGTNNPYWKGGKSIFKCVECGKEFKDYHRKWADRKFCSIECGYKNKERRTSVNCKHCGVEFEVFIYNLNRGRGRFCSMSCAKLFVADEVSERFKGKPKSLEHRRKLSESNKETKAPLRKQDRNVLRDIRKSFEMNEWRRLVFKRDDYTCQLCGVRGGDLNAHHILSFVNFPKYRLEIDNGITYCEECHEILTGILMTGDIFQLLPQLNV